MNHKSIPSLTLGEPAANLRHLLYGSDAQAKLPSPSSSADGGQNMLNHNFFANFDKAFDLDFTDSQQTSDDTLVKKQDEYIEQLENANRMLKEQLSVIYSKVQEVVSENQQLIQKRKSEAFNRLVPETTPKGLSDEEKMFRDHSLRDAEYINKIKHLEMDISLLREEQKNAPKEELAQNVTILQREKQSLSLKIDQLNGIIGILKEREDEAQNKIKQGIIMVEQAQMEKFQAVVERDATRENSNQQQKRFEEVVKDYERRIEVEKEKWFKFQENQTSNIDKELKEANSTIATLKSTLEKNEREKIDLRHQLQRVSSQLDNIQTEHGMSAEKFQEEVTKALIERNYALENLAQIKMANERMKIEHQKEVQWMKTELDDCRKKMDDSDRNHLKIKSELSKVQHQKKILERQLDYVKTTSKRQSNANKEDAVEITKYSKLREEQLQLLNESAKKQYVAKISELEKMLEKQMEIGKRFRSECNSLEEKLQKLVEIHNNSSADFRRQIEKLLDKTVAAESRCLQFEEKLTSSRRENDKKLLAKNTIIVEMENQQKMLIKERELLKNELKFVLEHNNRGNSLTS
ncbi:hypothetical protein CHUAL_003292 [Chamberlinius hualienensis]